MKSLTGLNCEPEILACFLRRRRRQPSPPTITVAGSNFVVFVVKTLASHYHSGLCRRQPSLPTIAAGGSDFVVFVVETASHYHSWKLPRAPT